MFLQFFLRFRWIRFFMDQKKASNEAPPASIKALMDDATLDSCNEDEEFSESFVCCVCLELIYKPIVLACGHISCFWCVNQAMDDLRESHCPVCRCPYSHFPSICEMLHFLLLKLYPVAYKKREKQVLEEEKKTGFSSPQFDDHFTSSAVHEELNLLDCPSHSSTFGYQSNLYSDSSDGKVNPSFIVEPVEFNESFHDSSTTVNEKAFAWNSETTKKPAGEENINDLNKKICKQVSVSDVMCTACKQLLFRPAVLNCGHAYCESCIATPAGEMLRCQVCESSHPKGFPKVCLEFDHFLEEQFSKEYELRREAVHLKQVHSQNESPSSCAAQAGKQAAELSLLPTKDDLSWWREHGSKVHFGVGCDSCGMRPITGDRYKCKDCEEKIGFDLCGNCYNTCSKRPGRFNQRHTPEHKFELVQSNMIDGIMLRLVAMQSLGFPTNGISIDASEDPQNALPAPILFGDALEVPVDGSGVSILSDDGPDDPEDASSVPISLGDGWEDPEDGSGALTSSDDAPEDPKGTHHTS